MQPALQDEPRRSRKVLGPSLAENRPTQCLGGPRSWGPAGGGRAAAGVGPGMSTAAPHADARRRRAEQPAGGPCDGRSRRRSAPPEGGAADGRRMGKYNNI